VGLTTTQPAAALHDAGADEVVAHLAGYDVAALLARLEGRPGRRRPRGSTSPT
jgi:hypothetical protein